MGVFRMWGYESVMQQHLTQDKIQTLLDENQIVVPSWEILHERLKEMRDTGWIFRGVSSPKYYPQPSIGRDAFGPYDKEHELRIFREFKKRAVAVLADPRLDDWHWLAYAQHVGVPTRLLDWSTSPLVAAFFALEKECTSDRAIFCVKYSTYLHEVEVEKKSPFDNRKLGRFSPPQLFERLRAQRGVFTIHPDPTQIFYLKNMKVIRIPRECVKPFRRILFKYGIDYWYVYPDTEGLGRQLKWQVKNGIGFGLRGTQV